MFAFKYIPGNLRVPGTRAEVQPGGTNNVGVNAKGLIIGQLLATGSRVTTAATSAASSSGTTLTFASATIIQNLVPGQYPPRDQPHNGIVNPGRHLCRQQVGRRRHALGRGDGRPQRRQHPVCRHHPAVDEFADQCGRALWRGVDAGADGRAAPGERSDWRILGHAAPRRSAIGGGDGDDDLCRHDDGRAGTLALYVGGVSVPVNVTSGMTATQAATAVAAAVNANTNLAVTASASSGVVTFTAKNAGLAGNDIDFRLNYYGPQNNEFTPAGFCRHRRSHVRAARQIPMPRWHPLRSSRSQNSAGARSLSLTETMSTRSTRWRRSWAMSPVSGAGRRCATAWPLV